MRSMSSVAIVKADILREEAMYFGKGRYSICGKEWYFARGEIRFREELSTVELMQEFVRDFAKQSKENNEQITQDAVTRILATIISAMGQQAGGYVAVPAMMQMQGMNVAPIPSETLAEPTEPVKELLEE